MLARIASIARPAGEHGLVAGREIGRGEVQRDLHVLDARIAERRAQPLHDQAVVAQAEARIEAQQLREHRAEHGAAIVLRRDRARPQHTGHLRGFGGRASAGNQRRVQAAGAAPDQHVDGDPGPVQRIDEPQRGRALDAARTDDDGHAALVTNH